VSTKGINVNRLSSEDTSGANCTLGSMGIAWHSPVSSRPRRCGPKRSTDARRQSTGDPEYSNWKRSHTICTRPMVTSGSSGIRQLTTSQSISGWHFESPPRGLSMALYEGSEFVKGQPKDTNLDTYTLLRMGASWPWRNGDDRDRPGGVFWSSRSWSHSRQAWFRRCKSYSPSCRAQ
jgi:hypothetical protein